MLRNFPDATFNGAIGLMGNGANSFPAWSSLEQGKKLQHFLLDRVAKFTSFVS